MTTQKISTVVCLALVIGCTQQPAPTETTATAASGAATTSSTPCQPLETREPNAASQRPTFAGQTRVCGVTSNTAFDVVVLTDDLEHPWAVEPLPNGDLLVTARPGRMGIVSAAGTVREN